MQQLLQIVVFTCILKLNEWDNKLYLLLMEVWYTSALYPSPVVRIILFTA